MEGEPRSMLWLVAYLGVRAGRYPRLMTIYPGGGKTFAVEIGKLRRRRMSGLTGHRHTRKGHIGLQCVHHVRCANSGRLIVATSS
ncbi:uncharacterized protein M421DRAFT_417663 [Didymella exigua CBS 183.55]|uniref:Uncharacterized protein n=1 Tax=Didymella exigua CBS 183.55 TaxID=1150837 RepID=A0A6A5S365_9PLEO|nr:uncharacterized protein M421DRAFT_417663 [Didymella exigua CBS 183.55]KAF1931927.1 hypothetical protein M421DRAFT_417663 [Didymella exigua CBS 183.55]